MSAFARALKSCACFKDDGADAFGRESSGRCEPPDDDPALAKVRAEAVAVAVTQPPVVSGVCSRQKTGKATWVNRYLATQDNFLVSYSAPPEAAAADGEVGGKKAKVLNALDLTRVADIVLVADDGTGLLFKIITAADEAGGGAAEHLMRAESPEMAQYFVDGLNAIRAFYMKPTPADS